MARRRGNQVTEGQLKMLIENWNQKETAEIAVMLEADEATVTYWAAKLRQSMKKQGVSDDMIKKLLPTRRRTAGNIFDIVARKLMSSEPVPKRRGRKAKTEE